MAAEKLRALHPLLTGLPDGTLRRLEIYAGLLQKWRRVVSLTSNSTRHDLWVRHFADSLQVADAAPDARRWLDLGSGAGFPGLVIAIKYADEDGARVHLVESNRRKCAFLREAARRTEAPAIVRCGRIEEVLPGFEEPIDAVSARALAPLEKLIGYAEKILARGATGIFPRGKRAGAELIPSLTAGKYLVTTIASQTDPDAQLAVIRRWPGQ